MNIDVTNFLNELQHPLREEIEQLRYIILSVDSRLEENIKWNGPNYCVAHEDRITMKIQPPKQIQLIFHRGTKRMSQPGSRIMDDASGLLVWKENDRAVASFKNLAAIQQSKPVLQKIVQGWLQATKVTT